MTALAIGIIISELVAVLLAWKILRTADPLWLRVINALVAFIPFFGPVFAYWASSFPEPNHSAHRDTGRYSSDVFDRWVGVLRTKDPVKRFNRWKEVIASSEREDS
jgi:hypothetical protein